MNCLLASPFSAGASSPRTRPARRLPLPPSSPLSHMFSPSASTSIFPTMHLYTPATTVTIFCPFVPCFVPKLSLRPIDVVFFAAASLVVGSSRAAVPAFLSASYSPAGSRFVEKVVRFSGWSVDESKMVEIAQWLVISAYSPSPAETQW